MPVIKFDNPSNPPDFEEINRDHPLAQCTDAPYDAGLTTHPGSRANNFKQGEEHFQTAVNTDTLYQLKSGPNEGKYLGANIFDFSEQSHGVAGQKYIASEAPFNAEDYYRMVVDQGGRILVSLTRVEEDVMTRERTFANYLLRDGVGIQLHHLGEGESVSFDDTTVSYHEQNRRAPKHGGLEIIVTTYKVERQGEDPYDIHHITTENWADGKDVANVRDSLELISAISESQAHLGADVNNPIVVNCIAGFGRTNTLIVQHQLAHMTFDLVDEAVHLYEAYFDKVCEVERLKGNIQVEIDPILHTLQSKVMDKAAGRYRETLEKFPNLLIERIISKMKADYVVYTLGGKQGRDRIY